MAQDPPQNPPQDPNTDLEQDDSDINIGQPPPDADYYDYDKADARTGFSWPAISIGATFIIGILLGIVYLAYMEGVEYGQTHLPPFIARDKAPVKVPPEKSEADSRFENGDLNIYNVISGDTQNGETTLAPSSDMADDMSDNMTDDMALQDKAETGMGAESATDDSESATDMGMDMATDAMPMDEDPTEAPTETQDAQLATAQNALDSPLDAGLIGPYAVQIGSVRSLAQAEITYGLLQQKFPILLAGREPMVQRADLGEQGIFFRLAITGFATRDAAQDFCSDMKTRNQDCFVREIN